MIKADENALICDLAETYRIYDYRQLPATTVAVFSCGLREDSRIKMLMNNQLVSLDSLLLAGISDQLGALLGNEKRESILQLLLSEEPKEKDERVFTSGEDFELARNKLIQRMGGES